MTPSKIPKLYDQLYDWIDRGPLVETLLGALEETDSPLDEMRARRLWFQVLEELPALLSMIIHREKVYERGLSDE